MQLCRERLEIFIRTSTREAEGSIFWWPYRAIGASSLSALLLSCWLLTGSPTGVLLGDQPLDSFR